MRPVGSVDFTGVGRHSRVPAISIGTSARGESPRPDRKQLAEVDEILTEAGLPQATLRKADFSRGASGAWGLVVEIGDTIDRMGGIAAAFVLTAAAVKKAHRKLSERQGHAATVAVPIPPTGTAGHRYLQGTQSLLAAPFVWDTALTFSTIKDAKTVMKAFRDASALAPTWDETRTDPPATLTLTSAALSFPKIGDDTLAVRLTGKSRDAEFGFESDYSPADYVVWRNGAVVSVLLAANVDTLTYVKHANDNVKTILVACSKPKHKKSKKN